MLNGFNIIHWVFKVETTSENEEKSDEELYDNGDDEEVRLMEMDASSCPVFTSCHI